jgi:hypothetical protein
MSRARVHVHIETLSVTGLPGLSRSLLAEAVQQQLQRGLHEHAGTLLQLQAAQRGRVDAGAFPVRRAAGSRDLGGQIAAAIQRGIVAP